MEREKEVSVDKGRKLEKSSERLEKSSEKNKPNVLPFKG
jgi:hypothetical protein